MQSCQEIEAVLTDYLFDELTEAEMVAVMQHLALCPNCRAALAELEQTILLLRLPQIQESELPTELSPDRLATVLGAAAESLPGDDADQEEAPAASVEPSSHPCQFVWLAVAAAAILALAATIFLALRDAELTASGSQDVAEGSQGPVIPEPVSPGDSKPPLKNVDPRPRGPGPHLDPQPKKLVKQNPSAPEKPQPPPEPEQIVKQDPPAPEKPQPPPEPEQIVKQDPPAPEKPQPPRKPREPSAPQIVRQPQKRRVPPPRRRPVRPPAPAIQQQPREPAPRHRPAPSPSAFAWARDLHNRFLIREQNVNLLVAVPGRDVRDPLELRSESTGYPTGAPGLVGEMQKAAAHANLILEIDPSGYVLKQTGRKSRSYRQSPEYAERTFHLLQKLAEIGCTLPQVKYSKRQERFYANGTPDQVKDLYEVIGIARRHSRDTRIGPAADPGHDPNAPVEEFYVRRSRRPASGGGPPAAAAAPRPTISSKGDRPSTRTRRSSTKEFDSYRLGRGSADVYPETRLGTVLEDVRLINVSPREAIAHIAKAGALDVKYRAGSSNLRLALFSPKITPVDALHLICRAADLELEIDDREIKISHGPYEPRLETRLYRLSKQDTEDIVGQEVEANLKTIRSALQKHGLSLPSGAAVAYEPEQGVLIIRSCPEDLDYLEDEIL